MDTIREQILYRCVIIILKFRQILFHCIGQSKFPLRDEQERERSRGNGFCYRGKIIHGVRLYPIAASSLYGTAEWGNFAFSLCSYDAYDTTRKYVLLYRRHRTSKWRKRNCPI